MTTTRRPKLTGTTDLPLPWMPPEATKPEWAAIKALYAGEATKEQQALFLGWMVKATGINELEFRPSDRDASAFAGGKRFVGQLFFTLAKATQPSK